MRTAVSVSDRLFRTAEQHTRRAHRTRSQPHAEAFAEYLGHDAPDEVTATVERVVDELRAAPRIQPGCNPPNEALRSNAVRA